MVERHISSEAADSAQIGGVSPVAEAFDRVAGIFDSNLENATTARLRMRLYSVIESLIQPGSSVLDVSCGTGIDALYLAKQGYRLCGIDISKKMITASRLKFEHAGIENVKFVVASYDRLSPKTIPLADLVFSNFGGMNCTPDLASAAEAIAGVTKPGGYFIGVIMPTFSLWEALSYAARLQWRQMLRRIHDHAPATGFDGTSFPVYYYSPGTATAAFSSHFERRQLIGLSIISPSPQSTRFVQRHPMLANSLIAIDGIIETFPLLRSIGDHYLIVLQRKT
jgi:ubiquinone/menaquinone biosynthesis C-methylase UbiE